MLFLQHVAYFCSVLDDVIHAVKKIRGLVILVGEWRRSVKKKGNERWECQKNRQKDLRNSVLSVCLFAHLLCVDIVFEQYLTFLSFVTILFHTECLHPPTKIPVLTD